MSSRGLRRLTGPATVLAVVGLVACGGAGGSPGAATATTTRTVTATAAATEVPGPPGPPDTATVTATRTVTSTVTAASGDGPAGPAPTSTAAVSAPASGAQVFLVDARAAAHDGFDRVVWELEGGGEPGYRVGWTDAPTRDGSGDPVDLPGAATLQVVVLGTGIPPDAPAGTDVYDGPALLTPSGTAVVTQVDVGTVFEGQLTAFVGARDERPFRVSLLSAPTRVVVDVAR